MSSYTAEDETSLDDYLAEVEFEQRLNASFAANQARHAGSNTGFDDDDNDNDGDAAMAEDGDGEGNSNAGQPAERPSSPRKILQARARRAGRWAVPGLAVPSNPVVLPPTEEEERPGQAPPLPTVPVVLGATGLPVNLQDEPRWGVAGGVTNGPLNSARVAPGTPLFKESQPRPAAALRPAVSQPAPPFPDDPNEKAAAARAKAAAATGPATPSSSPFSAALSSLSSPAASAMAAAASIPVSSPFASTAAPLTFSASTPTPTRPRSNASASLSPSPSAASFLGPPSTPSPMTYGPWEPWMQLSKAQLHQASQEHRARAERAEAELQKAIQARDANADLAQINGRIAELSVSPAAKPPTGQQGQESPAALKMRNQVQQGLIDKLKADNKQLEDNFRATDQENVNLKVVIDEKEQQINQGTSTVQQRDEHIQALFVELNNGAKALDSLRAQNTELRNKEPQSNALQEHVGQLNAQLEHERREKESFRLEAIQHKEHMDEQNAKGMRALEQVTEDRDNLKSQNETMKANRLRENEEVNKVHNSAKAHHEKYKSEAEEKFQKLTQERDNLQAEKEAIEKEALKLRSLAEERDRLKSDNEAIKEEVLQLQSLAEERDNLKSDNEAIKQDALQLQRLAEERDKFQAESEAFKKEALKLQKLTKERDRLKADNEVIKKEALQLQSAKTGSSEQLWKMTEERDKLKSEIDTIKRSAPQAESLAEERDKLKSEVEAMKDDLAVVESLKEERNLLKAENERLSEECTGYHNTVATKDSQINELVQAVGTQATARTNWEKKRKDFETQSAKADRHVDELKSKITNKDNEITQAKRERDNSQKALLNERKLHETASGRLKRTTTDLEASNKKLKDAEKKHQAALEDADDCRRQLEEMTAQCDNHVAKELYEDAARDVARLQNEAVGLRLRETEHQNERETWQARIELLEAQAESRGHHPAGASLASQLGHTEFSDFSPELRPIDATSLQGENMKQTETSFDIIKPVTIINAEPLLQTETSFDIIKPVTIINAEPLLPAAADEEDRSDEQDQSDEEDQSWRLSMPWRRPPSGWFESPSKIKEEDDVGEHAAPNLTMSSVTTTLNIAPIIAITDGSDIKAEAASETDDSDIKSEAASETDGSDVKSEAASETTNVASQSTADTKPYSALAAHKIIQAYPRIFLLMLSLIVFLLIGAVTRTSMNERTYSSTWNAANTLSNLEDVNVRVSYDSGVIGLHWGAPSGGYATVTNFALPPGMGLLMGIAQRLIGIFLGGDALEKAMFTLGTWLHDSGDLIG